ncbi:MAG: hypothetical protein AB7N65_09610 [Vicinamibacterales bacterium]
MVHLLPQSLSPVGRSSASRLRATGLALVLMSLATLHSPRAALAQPGSRPGELPPGMVEVDPLECWWRTSVATIMVGQPFTLVLTCAVVETESTAAVVDRARLDPRAIELAPFEVLGGTVADDVKTGDKTFFQAEYTLRFVNEAFFNQDIGLPPLTISYRIQTRGSGQDAATQGMERRFAMPPQSLRVASLVPNDASDIRDGATITFSDLDRMMSRGRTQTTSGLVLLGLAGVIALVGIGRSVGSRIRAPKTATALLAEAPVLRGAVRALAAVRKRRDGAADWSADDVAQALAATRIVSEAALDRAPNQRLAQPDDVIPSGALGLRRFFGRGPLVIVSGGVTAKTVDAALARHSGPSTRLTALRDALTTFTQAEYAEGGTLDETALDEALSTVQRIAQRLSLERTWLVQRLTLRAWRQPVERPAL